MIRQSLSIAVVTVLTVAAASVLAAGPGYSGPSSAGDVSPAAPPALELGDVRALFKRPAHMPSPPASPAVVALGKSLFSDTALSGSGKRSCASCHMPALSFTDGIPLAKGADSAPLPRNTPSLWNMAWGETFFWDGRARTLEEQAKGPITHPREMGGDLPAIVERLKARDDARQAFAAAFPDRPEPAVDTLLTALAAFERTLVSPPTTFDAWVAGDDTAIPADAVAGLQVFAGKGRCMTCHEGWRFADEAFHDIGLSSDDRGRGPIIGQPALDHAFKTPSLRELTWTAPYMHDGSLWSLDQVLNHYEKGIRTRPTLSPEIRSVTLTDDEKRQLLAFLNTLSSNDPPQPYALDGVAPVAAALPVDAVKVSQRNRQFAPGAVRVAAGTTLAVINDDTRPHNVRSLNTATPFDGGVQQPGQSVLVPFETPGTYELICGIHPKMKLTVEVTPEP